MSFLVQKSKPPRKLENETLESFDHWRSQFRTCYKRDPSYAGFFEDTSKWDSEAENWGQKSDKIGNPEKERSAGSKRDDLIDFLNLINSFLPNTYLQQKLVYQSKNLEDVWNFIRRSFQIEVTQLSFLKMHNITKRDTESFLAFYDRIVNGIRLHMAPVNTTVDNITTPAATVTDTKGGDKMSVTLLDTAALIWFQKIPHKNLAAICEIEYSTELRNNERLSSLVPKIAENVESLLARYNSTSVNSIQASTSTAQPTPATNTEVRNVQAVPDDSEEDNEYNKALINAAFKKYDKKYDKKFDGKKKFDKKSARKPFCEGCHRLNKKMKLKLPTSHNYKDCRNKEAVIRAVNINY